MEFYCEKRREYSDFRRFRFIELKDPDKIFYINQSISLDKYPCTLRQFMSKLNGSSTIKYSLFVEGNSINETIIAGSDIAELSTIVNDEEKENFIEKIFSFYGVIQTGSIPKKFYDFYDAEYYLYSLLNEYNQHDNTLWFDFDERYICLNDTPHVSILFQVNKNGFYHFYDTCGTFKEEKIKLAKTLHTFIQKQKVRMIVGVK